MPGAREVCTPGTGAAAGLSGLPSARHRGSPGVRAGTGADTAAHAVRVGNWWEEERLAASNTAITYILPDEGWAPLLEIIVRECPAASVIEVNTAGMQALAERMLREAGRDDVPVEL